MMVLLQPRIMATDACTPLLRGATPPESYIGDKKALLRLDRGQIKKELANQAKAPNNSIDIVQNKTKDVGRD